MEQVRHTVCGQRLTEQVTGKAELLPWVRYVKALHAGTHELSASRWRRGATLVTSNAQLLQESIAHLHGLEESNGVLIRRSPPRRWLGHSLLSPLDLRSKNELEHTPRADKLCGIKKRTRGFSTVRPETFAPAARPFPYTARVPQARRCRPGADSGMTCRIGHLLFMRGATLMAQPFDPTRLTTAGQAVALADSGEINHRDSGRFRGPEAI